MAFLKNLASSVLNSLLSNYFESFENKVVSFSLGGELELTELVIKRNILDNLHLPLKIKFGSVGRLKLVVPWTDLSKKPTTVMLDDVYLIAESNTNNKYDPADEENRLQQLKASKLKMFEMLQESKKQEGGDNKKADNSFGKRLATTVVDNLQLYINRVHIRFEETQNRIPFSVGLTIESLYGQSTDQNWKPAILPGATTTFKLVTLQNLAVYFNMGDTPLQFKTVKEAYQAMESLIYKSDNLPKHNFVLKPMSIGVKLVLNKQANGENKLPKATAHLLTESIFLRVNKDQFGAALATANRFSSLTLGAKYLKHRPQVTVKEKPAAWWGFALNSVMDDQNQKRNQYRWSTIKQRRDDRLLYVDLFQQIRLGKKLSPENDLKLKALEKRLSFEDIIFFRSLAEIKYRQYKKVEEQQQGKQSKIGGFFSGLFEKKEEKEQKQKKIMEEVLKVQFTEQDVQEVYRALELSESTETGPSNPEWIQYQVGATLQLASIVLGDETGAVANLVLEKFMLGLDLRDNWQTFRTELDSLMIIDNTSQTSLFPNIVRPVMTDTKLWTMRVDINPHNVANVDVGIEMIAKPLNIVMNGGFISRILKIFTAPVGEQIKSSLTSNLNPAQLKFLLENKKNIAMKIDLQAPNILIPQSFDKPDAPMLVVDLGKLNIGTVLAMKNSQGQNVDLNASAYDSLEIYLSRLQICLTTADKQADVHLLKAEMIKLIDPFTVDLTLQLSKLPDVETLSKVKLRGNMPTLKVNVSPNSLRCFVQILQSLLAQINAMTAKEGPQFPDANNKQLVGGDAFAREVMMQAMDQKKSNVKLFEGDFIISEAVISLMKSDTEPLLRVNFKGFEGTVNVQSLEVTVKAKLHGLLIEDLLQKYGARGASLASSLSEVDPGNDLVNFSFVTTNREAPQYNNIDSLMHLEFNTLKFVFNPVTMITTINLILQQLQPTNQAQQQVIAVESKEEDTHSTLKPVTQEELNFKRRGAHRATFKLHVKMNSLQLMLNEEQPLAEASLGGSSAEITVNEAGEVKIHGRLGALALSDLRAKERFRHVLKVDGEHLVDFKLQIDRSDRFANTDELKLNIDMNTLRVLYSHKFIMDIANYFIDFADLMNKFNQKDQPQVKPANAKNSIFTFHVAAQNLFVIGSSLDASATQALIIELGQINVGNTFSALPEPDYGFRDKLEVSISGMNARSGDLTSDDWRAQDLSPRNAHTEDKLLQDLTLALFIERPLFVNPITYQGPTMTLTANIPEINLNLSTNLAYLLLALLKGNIIYEPGAKEIEKWKIEQKKKLALEQSNPSPVVSPAASPNVAKKDRKPTTKINFIIPKLSIKLSHSNPAAEHGVEPLLMLDAIKFNFALDQFNDDSNEISLDLFALMLRDLKSKDKELHSDFKTFVRPKNQNEGQFGMKFLTKDSGHQDLTIKVDSFNIILIPKLIKSLIQSIMPVINEMTKTLEKNGEIRKLFLMEDLREQRLNELRKSRKIGLDMSFMVTRPQVFLIEDLTSGTSRAAIFTADFDVRFFIYGTQQKLNGYVKTLQMFKTNALSNSIALSADKQFNILKPVDVMLLMEISPEVFDLHVELSPLDLTLSYRDFKLGYKLAEPFLQVEEQPARPQLEPINNNNDAFVKSRSSPRMSPKFNAGSHRAEAEKPVQGAPAGPVRDEKVDLSQTSIQLHIVDDVSEAEPISLFQLSLTKIDAFVAAWSTKLKVRSAANLQANYFNSSLHVWEPFIEPMIFEVGVTGSHVNIVSEYSLNVNVTKALTRQAQQTYKKWKADFTNTPMKPKHKSLLHDALMGGRAQIQSLETSQYAIQNRTSIDLEMRFDVNNVNAGKQPDPQTYQLKAKSEPVSVPSELLQMAIISIKPSGMNLKWSKRINLRDYRTSSSIVALDFEGEPGQSNTRFYFAIAVVEEVVMNTKTAVITISPALVIDNQLLADVDYFIFPTGANTEISRAKIPKQDTIAVVDLPVDKSLQIAIKIPGFTKCTKQPLSPFKANNYTFSMMDEQGKTFRPSYELSIDAYGTAVATIYSPYWIINKSGLPLVFCTSKESKSVAPLQNQLKLDKDYQSLLLGEIEPRELYFKEFLNEAPLMLAFPGDPDLVMRMSGGYVSQPLSLKAQNSKGYVSVTNEKKDSKSQKLFELAVSVEPAKNRFWRTKVVIVYPRFFFVNKTSKTIFLMQEGVTKPFTLLPQETYPFHWLYRKPANKEKERAIAVKTENPNCDWSGAFTIDEQANYSITMRTLASQALGQLRVQSRLRDDGITIVDFYELNDNPLYCIQNNFSEPIIVFQKGGRVRLSINPKSTSNWGFDEPRLDPIVVVEVPRLKQLFQVNMDVITGTENEEEEDKKKKQNVPVQLQVNVEGGARVLSVSPQTGKPAVPKLAVESKETFRFTVKLRQIGLSVISQKPEELLFFCVDNFVFTYVNYPEKRTLELFVKDFQIDNQVSYILPTVLYSVAEAPPQFLRMSAVFSNLNKSVNHIQYFSVLLRETFLALDERTLLKLLYFVDITLETLQTDEDHDLGMPLLPENIIDNVANDPMQLNWVFASLIHINPMKFHISFIGNRDKTSEKSNLTSILLGIPKDLIVNIDRAPLQLRGVVIENQLSTQQVLTNTLLQNFKQQLIREVYKLVGSAEFLGNPIGFVQSLGTGVSDFFYEPAKGVTVSPEEFVHGVAKGTWSLVKNSIFGLFNSASKFTGSLGSGVAVLSWDEDYQRKRQEDRQQNKPQHALEGFGQGLLGLGKGIFHGVTGIIAEPIKGAQKEGGEGFFKGLGRGLAGVVVKPVVGALDLASKTTEGISNTTELFDKKVKRKRPPRHFATNKLEVYSQDQAHAEDILHTIGQGRHREEKFMFRTSLPEGVYMLVSDQTIVVRNGKENKTISRIPFSDVKSISYENGIVIIGLLSQTERQKGVKCNSNEDAAATAEKLKVVFNLWQQSQKQLF